MAKKKTKKETEVAKPVPHVDSTTARSDSDARVGAFVNVVKGKHKGRYGVLETVVTLGKDGYPDAVIVVSRDEHADRIVASYDDLVPAEAGERP